MRVPLTRSILLVIAIALAGCGGGGGSRVVSTPPPPPPPPAQAPAIIPAATTSQQFASMGASVAIEGDQTPQLGAGDQLQVRYVESSNSYEVRLPDSQTWTAISYLPTGQGTPINFAGDTAHLWLRSEGHDYSRLIEWSDGETIIGHVAIGIPTEAARIPTTGGASYSGDIIGSTSEVQGFDDMYVSGSIAIAFDFASGGLSGSITPILHQDFSVHRLGTIDFRDTVYSSGSTTFAGGFDTDLAGLNSFSGLFTGPNAEELIGNFALPYRSPIDSQTYQAAGAFVGGR